MGISWICCSCNGSNAAPRREVPVLRGAKEPSESPLPASRSYLPARRSFSFSLAPSCLRRLPSPRLWLCFSRTWQRDKEIFSGGSPPRYFSKIVLAAAVSPFICLLRFLLVRLNLYVVRAFRTV